MVTVLTVLVAAAYVVAAIVCVLDRSLRPPLLLMAGTITTVLEPLWGRLLGIGPFVPGDILRVGTTYTVPIWTLLGGGVLLALPPLVIAYGLRHHWWVQHYAVAWVFFISFVLFFLFVMVLESRWGVMFFARPQLPRSGLPETLLQAFLLAGISYGILYTFVATRHYALRIAFVSLLASGLAASVLLLGILCSPFWVARLLHQRDQIVLLGAGVSVLLVVWAIHLLASGLHEGRRQHLQWR